MNKKFYIVFLRVWRKGSVPALQADGEGSSPSARSIFFRLDRKLRGGVVCATEGEVIAATVAY